MCQKMREIQIYVNLISYIFCALGDVLKHVKQKPDEIFTL